MTRPLFEDFRDNPSTYRACEAYWQGLLDELMASLGQRGEWRRWIPQTYADGKTTIEKDGNPIFDGRSDRLNRAFRIIQQRLTNKDVPEISAWLKSYEPEFTELPRDELVVNLSLSVESADLARTLLRKWMEPATTPAEMQALIDST